MANKKGRSAPLTAWEGLYLLSGCYVYFGLRRHCLNTEVAGWLMNLADAWKNLTYCFTFMMNNFVPN